MDPERHPGAKSRKILSDDELREITRIAARHGWEDVANRVVIDKRAIEQESVILELPY